MRKNNWFFFGGLLLIFSLALGGCKGTDEMGSEAIITTKLTMGYIPNIQFAPVYVALEKEYFREAGFEVELEYGNETDAVALVGAGEQTYAIASGEQVLLARAQDLPVIYVAAWYQDFPVGVVAKSDQRIQVPENLSGERVGIPGLYGASYIGLKALLSAGGLTESDLDLRSIGYNQVEALAANQVDAAVIYVPNEPVVLRSQGYQVDVIHVADYIQLVGNGLVTNEEAIQNQPEQVRAFINALLKGIEDTIENPGEAFEISKGYVENLAEDDASIQREVLDESIKLWGSDHLGFSEAAGWINMQQVLMDMGLLNKSLDLEKVFTNDLLP